MAQTKTTIGSGTKIVGQVTSEEDLTVEGRIDGGPLRVRGRLTVAAAGSVSCEDTEVGDALVIGVFSGTLRARDVVRIHTTSGRVLGEIMAARAAEKAGWGQPMPKGTGRGISLQFAFGSYMAHVAEVEVAKDGEVRVRRVVCAMDCGTVVNPNTAQAQIQSGIIFGVTAALYGEITLKNGRVEQGNFNDYPVLRMNEMPKVEVHIVQSSEKPGGIGEPGTPPIAPAVANAIFAATGKRLRKLPFDTAELKSRA